MTGVMVIQAFGMVIALVAVAFGLWVLLKQKIIVDQKGKVTQVDVPLLGKITTNYPALVAVLGGIALAWSVVGQATTGGNSPPLVEVRHSLLPAAGQENKNHVVNIVPNEYIQAVTPGIGNSTDIKLPVESGKPYTVLVYWFDRIDPETGQPMYRLSLRPVGSGDFFPMDPRRGISNGSASAAER